MDIETEKKWRDLWLENHIFEPEVENGHKKFFVTVPWPYTNGSLHVGHGRTYTLGDIIARYKRLTGYNVLFPMAFHESGTPILAFSERLRNHDPDTLKLYTSYLKEYEKSDNIPAILKSFEEPKNIADYFSRVIVKDFRNLGYSIDWTRQFTSGDSFYQEIVKWQFNNLKKLGLIKRGKYPILYSIDDENAVGEDDIKDGDTEKVTIEEFTGILFKGPDFYLMAASLRPETIFGITNIWINGKAHYVLLDYNSLKICMSYEGYLKFALQHDNARLLSDISIHDIMDAEYTVPISKAHTHVLEAEFVDPDNGTGIVYSVPGHSIFDFLYYHKNKINNEIKNVVSLDSDINVVSLVKKYNLMENEKGLKEATQELYKEEFYNGKLVNSGKYSGLSVAEGRELIKNDLIKNNMAIIFYETTRKAVTRSGSKVIVAILNDQWFIDYSPEWLKKKAHEIINSMQFYPEIYRKLMNDAIDWLRERPCARKRGIGTKLPFDNNWVIESLSDSTIYMIVYTNKNELENIFNHLHAIPEDILDFIFFNKQLNNEYDQYTINNMAKARSEFNYWYGNDLRITAPPHISNHLSFFVMNHAALFSGKDLPGGLLISGLVISNGSKISKSKGNVISLLDIVNRYSADLYRLFIAVGADISSLLDWNEKDLLSVKKRYTYFTELMDSYTEKESPGTYIYKWFYSSFYLNLKNYLSFMESMDIRDAYISIFYNVINDLKSLESRGGDINAGLGLIIKDWLRALSPVIPYACEEYWHRHVSGSFVSSEKLDADITGKIDYSILKSENYLQSLLSDIKEILKIIKIKPVKVLITVYGNEQQKFIDNYRNNKVEGKYKIMIGDYIKNKKRISEDMINEYSIIIENMDFIKMALGLDVDIHKADGIMAKNPWPGRPLIKIE
ncbi:MAG: leucine--tRNA ligase [Ferroplasma sp.]